MNLALGRLVAAAKAEAVARVAKCGACDSAPCACQAPAPAFPLTLLTDMVEGHQHMLRVWSDDVRAGSGGTTYSATSADAEHPHDHAWVLNADGSIFIAMSDGHTHQVDAAAVPSALLARR